MGYTPAFDTLYTGTLYGKWPAAAVWASLLPLVNAKGEINFSHEAISGMTGWPMELLRKGIEALCQPDARSQSKAEEGRRLVPIDSSRDWGWRVVNIGIYRQKASGMNQVADGRNAEKVRRYKERHKRTPQDTAGHQGDTHSDSNTDSDSNKEQEGASAPPPGLDLKAWEEWFSYRADTKKPIRPASVRRAQEELAKHGPLQADVVAHSIAQGYQGLFAPKTSPSKGKTVPGMEGYTFR